MNLLREKLRACGHHLAQGGGGGGSSSSLGLSTTTINQDSRAVLQDAVQVGENSNSTVGLTSTSNTYTYAADAEVMRTLAENMPDSIAAMASMGATVIRDSGGAVVDLLKDSAASNTKAWDSTLQYGSDTVDHAIDLLTSSFGIAADNVKQGNSLASKVVDAFTPTESKNADIGKYAIWAAAAVAAAVLLKGKS